MFLLLLMNDLDGRGMEQSAIIIHANKWIAQQNPWTTHICVNNSFYLMCVFSSFQFSCLIWMNCQIKKCQWAIVNIYVKHMWNMYTSFPRNQSFIPHLIRAHHSMGCTCGRHSHWTIAFRRRLRFHNNNSDFLLDSNNWCRRRNSRSCNLRSRDIFKRKIFLTKIHFHFLFIFFTDFYLYF